VSGGPVLIRTARMGDYDALVALFDELDEFHRQARPDIFRRFDGPARPREQIAQWLAGPGSTVLVAESEQDVVGLAVLLARPPPSFPGAVPRKVIELDNIVVRADQRSQRIGWQLLEATVAWTRGQGASHVAVAVHAFNRDARRFYGKFGFLPSIDRLVLAARGRYRRDMPLQALRTILPIAEWSGDPAASVTFTGGTDPVLPTPFRIGVAGAATLAASGLAAAALWEARSGRRQSVTVDLRQATASLRSGTYMKLGDGHLSHARNSIMGVYPSRDGRWSYLHCNFPNHRAAALGVLGVAEDRAAVTRAVAGWNAADLEEAIIAAKGAGGMVRSHAEWAAHPQAAAIAALPLMEIVRIGDSPPEPLPSGNRPLTGIRVLDLTRVLAGPTCARTLAEHGADVMKITAAHLPNLGYQEWDTGHGKLSAQLDLRAPDDLEALRSLVREADVFSQGYRPGSLAGRSLSPEELAALRPGLIYVSLSAFGHTGPWSSRRGFDTVVQTVSGMTARQVEIVPGKTAGPQFYPVSAIDYCTGYLMAFGAMVALARRAQEGGSWLVRISLAQVGKWMVDLGEVPAASLKDVPDEFRPEELARWSTVSETPSGRLRHLKPVVQMSETVPHWARPSVPLGYHRPVWPARESS
jgi:crotonobetainyl-CoA:carnitine CoA-transferase CaiB-like acyl-CoA transferase/GNAT superfamily N-acetyltransferase